MDMFKALTQDFERQFLNAVEEDDVKEFRTTLSLVEPSESLSSLALRTAIKKNSLKVMPLLFEHNFQPKDEDKKVLFKLAAELDCKEALVLMSERWALSCAVINEAFSTALLFNHTRIYTFLFEEMNADINYRNGIHLLAISGQSNHTTVSFLIKNSPDPTALSKMTLEELTKGKGKDKVLFLLDAGVIPSSYSHLPFPWLMEFLGYPDDMTPIDYLNHRDFDPQYRTICLNAITHIPSGE
tara:strand:- start:2330 stop:3052 length:723 start_codon:yes stop_codon:yes gene_type:complete